MVNAAGPWVADILRAVIRLNTTEGVRLVRGSHIVTRKLYDHDRCYFFQGTDGRIIFAIPYEQDFTLIGTTDKDHQGAPKDAVCTPEERDYLEGTLAAEAKAKEGSISFADLLSSRALQICVAYALTRLVGADAALALHTR